MIKFLAKKRMQGELSPCTVSTPVRVLSAPLSVESVNDVNGNADAFRFRHLSRSSSERLGVRKFDIQPSHIGTRSHPCMGLGVKNPHSPKFRDFLNLFAEKRKRISANKFPNSRKYSRLFAEINSRVSANIFWIPRLTRVLAGRILRSLSQIQKKSWNSSLFPCAKTLFVVYLSWKVR